MNMTVFMYLLAHIAVWTASSHQDVVNFEPFYVTWTRHCLSTFPMMQRGKDPAGIFKTMAEVSNEFNLTSNSEDSENTSGLKSKGSRVRMRLSFSSENGISTQDEPNMTCEITTLQSESSAEIAEQSLTPTVNTRLKTKNAIELKDASTENNKTEQHGVHNSEDKENTALPSAAITPGRRDNECCSQ